MNTFYERLSEYRNSLNLNKREFAEFLDISESYYNIIEKGIRKPSSNFINNLVSKSNKPVEYWEYGISIEEYKKTRDNFKSLNEAINYIIQANLTNDINNMFNTISANTLAEELIIKALKSDFSYINKKQQQD